MPAKPQTRGSPWRPGHQAPGALPGSHRPSGFSPNCDFLLSLNEGEKKGKKASTHSLIAPVFENIELSRNHGLKREKQKISAKMSGLSRQEAFSSGNLSSVAPGPLGFWLGKEGDLGQAASVGAPFPGPGGAKPLCGGLREAQGGPPRAWWKEQEGGSLGGSRPAGEAEPRGRGGAFCLPWERSSAEPGPDRDRKPPISEDSLGEGWGQRGSPGGGPQGAMGVPAQKPGDGVGEEAARRPGNLQGGWAEAFPQKERPVLGLLLLGITPFLPPPSPARRGVRDPGNRRRERGPQSGGRRRGRESTWGRRAFLGSHSGPSRGLARLGWSMPRLWPHLGGRRGAEI